MTETGYGAALFIGQGGSTVTLTPSASTIDFGDSETLTFTVTAILSRRPAATGNVSFYDGTTLLSTVPLSAGTTTYSSAPLAVGAHTIKAVYSGDANYNPATAVTTAVTVATLSPAFTLAGTPSTVTVTGGSQGVVTLALAANPSFSGAVTLACSGMPTNGTCAVNPGSVTLSAGGSTTATLVIGTTANHAELQRPASPWGAPATGVSLAAIIGVFFVRRKRIRMMSALGLVMMLSISVFLAGCGSSGNSKTKSAPTVTPGTYSVTVTATPASGSTAVAQSTTIAVTVN